MKIVCVASPKGGVGKTTVTANVAYALQRLGMKVIVIDFDVQNALRLHFGIGIGDNRGYVANGLDETDWRHLIVETRTGIRLLPYGHVTAEQRHRFESALGTNPDFLGERLAPLLQTQDTILLADMVPGVSNALDAVCRLQPICVGVMLSDTSSSAVLPIMESGEFFGRDALDRTFYIINQFDMRSALNRDVTSFLKLRLGQSLLGVLHRDEAIQEAHANQVSIFQQAPGAAIVHDIENVAQNLQRLLMGESQRPSAFGAGAPLARAPGSRL